jgi:hypothetical protein
MEIQITRARLSLDEADDVRDGFVPACRLDDGVDADKVSPFMHWRSTVHA